MITDKDRRTPKQIRCEAPVYQAVYVMIGFFCAEHAPESYPFLRTSDFGLALAEVKS